MPVANEQASIAVNRVAPLKRPGKIALAPATPVRMKQRADPAIFDTSRGMNGNTDAP
jgi:hypothetical protein